MTEFVKRSAAARARSVFAGFVFLAVLLSGGPAFSESEGGEDLPPIEIPKTGMKSGRLTEKHDKGAEIGGQGYKFHPNVEFGDDENRRLEWKNFKRGDEVLYHLKKEQIDVLIRVLPK